MREPHSIGRTCCDPKFFEEANKWLSRVTNALPYFPRNEEWTSRTLASWVMLYNTHRGVAKPDTKSMGHVVEWKLIDGFVKSAH